MSSFVDAIKLAGEPSGERFSITLTVRPPFDCSLVVLAPKIRGFLRALDGNSTSAVLAPDRRPSNGAWHAHGVIWVGEAMTLGMVRHQWRSLFHPGRKPNRRHGVFLDENPSLWSAMVHSWSFSRAGRFHVPPLEKRTFATTSLQPIVERVWEAPQLRPQLTSGHITQRRLPRTDYGCEARRRRGPKCSWCGTSLKAETRRWLTKVGRGEPPRFCGKDDRRERNRAIKHATGSLTGEQVAWLRAYVAARELGRPGGSHTSPNRTPYLTRDVIRSGRIWLDFYEGAALPEARETPLAANSWRCAWCRFVSSEASSAESEGQLLPRFSAAQGSVTPIDSV